MFLLDTMLRKIVRQGELIVTEADGTVHRYGTPDGRLPIAIRFHDRRAPNHIALHPRLGIGEAYMDGRVSVEQGDILGLIDLIRSNAPWEGGESAIE